MTSEVIGRAFKISSVGTLFCFVQNGFCVLCLTVIFSTGLLYKLLVFQPHVRQNIVMFGKILNK